MKLFARQAGTPVKRIPLMGAASQVPAFAGSGSPGFDPTVRDGPGLENRMPASPGPDHNPHAARRARRLHMHPAER